ncbi:MAG: ABC transporter substrate-binding protein [Gammaproteobacteria bacterium]|nr:ABC transporter substrate-binding protein [Gammaproteobacteria bacterium]MCF6229426.1 ABC transporter substrate-binding protein [Gammaproteobacteria bacterium]
MIAKHLLWLLLILGLVGCGSPPPEGLRFAIANAPVTLDPRFSTDATSARVNRLIYQQLIDFDEANRAAPALAQWQQLGERHYRFQLTGDPRFHDGTPLQAADVLATYQSVLDPGTASPHRATLMLIESMVTLDERTIDFHLNKSDPLFPGYLVIGILPRKLLAAQHPFNTQPVGSGPFKFVAWPEEGRLQLERLSDQRSVTFVRVKDPTVRALKLLRGEVDLLQNELPAEIVQHLVAEGMQVERRAGSNFSYLGFNFDDPLTGQQVVREAIAYALDRESIIHYLFADGAQLATSLLPPSHWAGHPGLTPYPYDPERARQLLSSIGVSTNKPLRISYKTSSDPFRIRLATVIQQQLDEVNIKVDIQSYDWGTFYGDIKKGVFQMYSLAWVGIKTPDIYRYVFHSEAIPPNGANRGRYVNPEVDRLIEQAESASTQDMRVAAYRKLQALVYKELPYVPLWYEEHLYVARPDIQGYVLSSDGNYDGLIHVQRQ